MSGAYVFISAGHWQTHTAQSRVVLPVRTGLDIWAKAEDLQQLVNESNESMKSKGSSDL